MADTIILVAETGSDINPQLAAQYGIHLVPMHVSMGDATLDDGSFPAEDIHAYYERTGKTPTTSGSTPYDFETIFEEIFAEDPNAQVLYSDNFSEGFAAEDRVVAGDILISTIKANM